MTCGCITPSEHPDLQVYVNALVPSTMTDLVNTSNVGESLYRSGGTGGTLDAYGFTTNYVEGTGCGYWEYRQYFSDLTTNNLIVVILADEFDTPNNNYGHIFNNFFGLQRVAWVHGATIDPSLYYGPLGNPFEVGWTVGFRFCIYYNNGNVWLDQNVQGTTDTNDFESLSGGGLPFAIPNDRRYRVKVFVIPDIAEGAHSPLVSETIVPASDVCADAQWNIPPWRWTGTATVTNPPPIPASRTMRFDAGQGSSYYLIPPVIDSGNELRSKTVKSMRSTGRRTNVSMKGYGYDLDDEINVQDLEDGTNASTRAQALPDTTQVAQSPRKQINIKNAVLHTVRLEGDDTGNEERDEIHEIVIEQADEGVRR